jgi:predicted nucleotidyltransferase component of viral defense system
VQVDIGIGDAVTPAPEWLEYPGLLDLPRPRLRAYPRETVVAEKLHAIALLGLRNSRLKDYFDLYALAKEGALDRRHLVAAIAATFERRQLAVPDNLPSGLSEAFGKDRDKNTQWAAFLDRNRLDAPSLVDVVTTLREAFVHPLSEARLRERDR